MSVNKILLMPKKSWLSSNHFNKFCRGNLVKIKMWFRNIIFLNASSHKWIVLVCDQFSPNTISNQYIVTPVRYKILCVDNWRHNVLARIGTRWEVVACQYSHVGFNNFLSFYFSSHLNLDNAQKNEFYIRLLTNTVV